MLSTPIASLVNATFSFRCSPCELHDDHSYSGRIVHEGVIKSRNAGEMRRRVFSDLQPAFSPIFIAISPGVAELLGRFNSNNILHVMAAATGDTTPADGMGRITLRQRKRSARGQGIDRYFFDKKFGKMRVVDEATTYLEILNYTVRPPLSSVIVPW